MRILLVEDHVELARWIAEAFRGAGYAVDVLGDGSDADHALQLEGYALVILDLSLPGMDGLEVLRRLRARKQTVPVLLLTARGDVSERVRGLDRGADDYLTKPFALEELEARAKALLRRGQAGGLPRLTCGELAFDAGDRAFTLRGKPLHLTRRETAVLEVLVTRAGRAVSRDHLFAQVFGMDDEANPEALEIYVHRVRKKLEGGGVAIRTLRGLGYLLEPA
jgi:two-component system response regulator TctD